MSALTILEGSTFCICDEIGDLDGETSGLFADDTRFLSRLELKVNGERPLLLSHGRVEYFSAAFYLRNPLAGDLEQDSLSITRERFVGDGMQDHVTVQNQSMKPISFELALSVSADFADIFTVKGRDFAFGDPRHAPPLPPPVPCRYDPGPNQFVFEDGGDGTGTTQVIFSAEGDVEGSTMRRSSRLASSARRRSASRSKQRLLGSLRRRDSWCGSRISPKDVSWRSISART